MRNIKEILRMSWESKLSSRQIARSCGCSHTTILDIQKRAAAAGLKWPLPENIDETTLERMLYPKLTRQLAKKAEPDFNYIHRELRKHKSVTLMLLWQEYRAQHENGLMYSQFCDRYRRWRQKVDVCMRQYHRAGEKMFVDWAGQTIPIFDPKTGKSQDAYIFVAVLGASSYTYAEAFLSQELPKWISAHRNAFNYFQGVPEIIVPDNLKTGVTKPCYYEPVINPTYQEMAEHYGTAIIPARVRKPKDKSKVENAVLIVERWILAALRNYTFFSLSELNNAIKDKLEVLNTKPFQKMEGCRRTLFETVEKPALQPLPEQPYVFAVWKKARVNIDYHIQFDFNYYSVPYQLVKEEVEVRGSLHTVEIFYKGKRVASHPRLNKKYHHSTLPQHCPVSHRKYLEWTPSKIVDWAKKIGPKTAELVQKNLNSKGTPVQRYRSCLGMIRLGNNYPSERMEAAAERALLCNAISYRSLKSILEKGLDQTELPKRGNRPPVEHENIRGSSYYGNREGVHPLC
ncbi:MAG: IS21 family transposase [Thermacetogeniaceae bacterium]|jgi:transposase